MKFTKKDTQSKVQISEEIDVKDRTVDTLAGRVKTDKKDSVGPGANFKSTKVRFHAGPDNAEGEDETTTDTVKQTQNKEKLGMKESFTLRTFKEKYEENSIFDQMIAEVLSKDASAGEWIHDFVHSDNPKFAGKSKAERKKQALAAYYAKQRNEEVEQIDELKKSTLASYAKKATDDVSYHSFSAGTRSAKDPERLKDDQKAMKRQAGVSKAVDRLAKEEVEPIVEGKMDQMSLTHLWHAHAKHSYGADQGWGGGEGGHHSKHAATAIENHVRKNYGNKVADDMVSHSEHHVAHAEYVGGKESKEVEKSAEKLRKKHGIKGDLYGNHESVNEGWEEMMKAVKAKRGPQPSGGSGVKSGSRYGGSKQKDAPEQDDDKKKVTESKRPESDDVPFVTTESKPLTNAKDLAKKSMSKLKNEMMGKISN